VDSKEVIEQIENYVKALEILKEPKSKLYTALKEIVPLLQQDEVLKAENVELKAYRQIVSELKWKPSILTHGILPLWLRELEKKYLKEVNHDYPESRE